MKLSAVKVFIEMKPEHPLSVLHDTLFEKAREGEMLVEIKALLQEKPALLKVVAESCLEISPIARVEELAHQLEVPAFGGVIAWTRPSDEEDLVSELHEIASVASGTVFDLAENVLEKFRAGEEKVVLEGARFEWAIGVEPVLRANEAAVLAELKENFAIEHQFVLDGGSEKVKIVLTMAKI